MSSFLKYVRRMPRALYRGLRAILWSNEKIFDDFGSSLGSDVLRRLAWPYAASEAHMVASIWKLRLDLQPFRKHTISFIYVLGLFGFLVFISLSSRAQHYNYMLFGSALMFLYSCYWLLRGPNMTEFNFSAWRAAALARNRCPACLYALNCKSVVAVVCPECGHKWQIDVSFPPTSSLLEALNQPK